MRTDRLGQNRVTGSKDQSTLAPSGPTRVAPRPLAPRPLAERTAADIDLQLARAKVLGHRLRVDRGTIQPKLTLGPAADAYEREADQVAQQVMTSLAAPAVEEAEISDAPAATAQPKYLQRASSLQAGGAIDSSLESSIDSQRSGGRALDVPLRSSMESAFGADFSGVKVHADGKADQLNRSLEARAFTTGQDIFFRQGEYRPGSASGQQLLAHELTHVVQQNGAKVREP